MDTSPALLKYLGNVSSLSLKRFALARRNHSANLLKEAHALLAQAIEELAQAEAAEWLAEHRE